MTHESSRLGSTDTVPIANLTTSRALIAITPHFVYPLKKMASTGSVFMTIAIAVERFMAINRPLSAYKYEKSKDRDVSNSQKQEL